MSIASETRLTIAEAFERLLRDGMPKRPVRTQHAIRGGHERRQPVARQAQRIGKKGLQQRRRIGKTTGLDDDAPEGRQPAGRHGLTVSAVCSVTDTPPTLLVCINANAFAHDAFIENGVLCVNVLNADHQELSRSFARWTGEDRFASGTWTQDGTGAPVLSGASASFDCRIVDHQRKGTHTVLFCEVQATALCEPRATFLSTVVRSTLVSADTPGSGMVTP